MSGQNPGVGRGGGATGIRFACLRAFLPLLSPSKLGQRQFTKVIWLYLVLNNYLFSGGICVELKSWIEVQALVLSFDNFQNGSRVMFKFFLLIAPIYRQTNPCFVFRELSKHWKVCVNYYATPFLQPEGQDSHQDLPVSSSKAHSHF